MKKIGLLLLVLIASLALTGCKTSEFKVDRRIHCFRSIRVFQRANGDHGDCED